MYMFCFDSVTAYIYLFLVFILDHINEKLTFGCAAQSIFMKKVAICTRAVQPDSSLTFTAEMFTASIFQQAGVTDRLGLWRQHN